MACSLAALRRVASTTLRVICATSFVCALVAADLLAPAAHATPGCAKCGNDPEPQPQPGPAPHGDRDGFVGQAALMNKSGQVVDAGASTCPGCQWRLQKACELGGQVICHTLLQCGTNPDGSTRFVNDVFLMRPGTTWQLRGSLCLGDNEDPLTPDDIWQQVTTQWRALVPRQTPTVQPPDGRAIVQLPTYFHSGQPAQMPATTLPVFNFQVTVTARGQWTWTFEPGTTKHFDIPGSHYDDPNPVVNHTYHTTGPRTVTLTTQWWGTLTIANRGPYDIATPAIQGPYDIPLDVIELQPVLGANR